MGPENQLAQVAKVIYSETVKEAGLLLNWGKSEIRWPAEPTQEAISGYPKGFMCEEYTEEVLDMKVDDLVQQMRALDKAKDAQVAFNVLRESGSEQDRVAA